MPSPFSSYRYRLAFTLLEMLVVVAIVVVLIALIAPPIGNVAQGFALTRQGQVVNDQLVLARQRATARNRDVEVRFIRPSGTLSTETPWAIQVWELDPATGTALAVGQRRSFDGMVTLHEDLSPLLEHLPEDSASGETWRSLRFRPNGRLAENLTMANNYLTLYLRRDSASPPANYCTLQIHPLSGNVVVYRP